MHTGNRFQALGQQEAADPCDLPGPSNSCSTRTVWKEKTHCSVRGSTALVSLRPFSAGKEGKALSRAIHKLRERAHQHDLSLDAITTLVLRQTYEAESYAEVQHLTVQGLETLLAELPGVREIVNTSDALILGSPHEDDGLEACKRNLFPLGEIKTPRLEGFPRDQERPSITVQVNSTNNLFSYLSVFLLRSLRSMDKLVIRAPDASVILFLEKLYAAWMQRPFFPETFSTEPLTVQCQALDVDTLRQLCHTRTHATQHHHGLLVVEVLSLQCLHPERFSDTKEQRIWIWGLFKTPLDNHHRRLGHLVRTVLIRVNTSAVRQSHRPTAHCLPLLLRDIQTLAEWLGAQGTRLDLRGRMGTLTADILRHVDWVTLEFNSGAGKHHPEAFDCIQRVWEACREHAPHLKSFRVIGARNWEMDLQLVTDTLSAFSALEELWLEFGSFFCEEDLPVPQVHQDRQLSAGPVVLLRRLHPTARDLKAKDAPESLTTIVPQRVEELERHLMAHEAVLVLSNFSQHPFEECRVVHETLYEENGDFSHGLSWNEPLEEETTMTPALEDSMVRALVHCIRSVDLLTVNTKPSWWGLEVSSPAFDGVVRRVRQECFFVEVL